MYLFPCSVINDNDFNPLATSFQEKHEFQIVRTVLGLFNFFVIWEQTRIIRSLSIKLQISRNETIRKIC